MTDEQTDKLTDEPTDERPPIERVLDLALYAPVGMALTLRDELPRHVKQGRQALENRVQLARFIGQLAVQAGQRELAKRIEEQRAAKLASAGVDATDDVAAGSTEARQPSAEIDAASVIEDANESVAIDIGNEPAGDETAGTDSAGAATTVPTTDQLPISDYESLAAIHVVERLRSMRPDEIEAIRRFEVAHRSRRTILAKIDQLQGR